MTTTDRARAYLAAVPGSDEGNRDHATIGAACKLVERFDLADAEQLALLLAWNGEHNRPALTEAQVRKCLASARGRTSYNTELANGRGNGQATASAPHNPAPRPAMPSEPPAAPLPTDEELDRYRRVLRDNDSEKAEKARAYLAAVGIAPAACGWGLCNTTRADAEAARLPHTAVGVRLVVPVYLPDGTLADVRRYRGPFGDEVNGDKLLPWSKGYRAAPYRFDRLAVGAERVVWCEGEKDCEALAAAGFDAVANTCGAGSAASVARALPAELVTGRAFVLLFDADEAGDKGAGKLAEVLAGRGATVRVARWPAALPNGESTPDGFDAADWLAAGYGATALRDLLAAAEPYNAPTARQTAAEGADGQESEGEAGPPAAATCLRDFGPYVDRTLSKRASRGVKQRVSKGLAEWAIEAGRLVWDPAVDRGYLVDDGRAVPLADESDIGLWVALRAAGVNPTETAFRWLLADLKCAAASDGARVRLARWSQCNRDTATVYVSCGDREVVRARPDGDGVAVELVVNGTDGVLFARDACLPAWRPAEPLDPLTLQPFRCPLESVGDYTDEVQRALLRAWLVAAVANLRPLPILAALGSKGSGKTTLARSLARLLLGPDSDVVPLGDDARDFDTSVTTKPLHALDNIDASETPPWFPDRLATVVTGGAIERRALFTNSGVYRAPITAALAITSRTAAYARTDVAERALPIMTLELEDSDRAADADLAATVNAARDACLTWLVVNAAELLRALPDAPDALPGRFVDFSRLVWADARADGREGQARLWLLALRQAQATLVGEGNPLLEAILAMQADEEIGRVVLRGTATDIAKGLQAETDVDLPHYGGGKALARHLRELAGILRALGWRLAEEKRGNNSWFTIQGPAQPEVVR